MHLRLVLLDVRAQRITFQQGRAAIARKVAG
jgi:hypothetical protein